MINGCNYSKIVVDGESYHEGTQPRPKHNPRSDLRGSHRDLLSFTDPPLGHEQAYQTYGIYLRIAIARSSYAPINT